MGLSHTGAALMPGKVAAQWIEADRNKPTQAEPGVAAGVVRVEASGRWDRLSQVEG